MSEAPILRGSGDRLHAVNQAARLRQVANELESDLDKRDSPNASDYAPTVKRIAQHRADASDFENAVYAYDARHRQLTQGEIDSGIQVRP